MAIVYGTSSSETINAADGVTDFADTIYGYNGSDTIFGLGGNDWIIGGLGADAINGGSGIDTALYTDSFDGVTVNLTLGTGSFGTAHGDTLTSIENLYGSGFDDALTGNSANNVLSGMGGGDILRGLGGADVLSGGAGNDILIGGAGADTMYGGEGSDDELNYYDSSAAVSVSLLTGTGSGGDAAGDTFSGMETVRGSIYNDTIEGDSGINYLYGDGGHDTLDGGEGADNLSGGDGNDTYYVDNNLDTVVENSNGTYDTLLTSVSYALDDGCDIELFRTTNDAGFGSIDLTGNASSQEVRGNAGSNLLAGGLGNDILVGLGGEDAFIFNTALGASNIDTMADYILAQDQIRLDNAIFANLAATEGNWLTASEFTIGAAAVDADDRIIYDSTTGALFYDSDGSGAEAAVQFATLTTGLALTNNEFFIV